MSLLPEGFADLEPLAERWALATETERNRHRLTSPMSEIQALYDTLLPRMEAVLNYLGQFPLDNLSEDAKRLFHLALSLAEVATAVENYKQPSVVDGYDSTRLEFCHDRAD
ncbi:MAG: hypothetical protein J4F42_10795 [Desulfurellaceae bacterium]|nr:hypothetical protein [Desulfurellaceae bacterium]